MSSYENKTWKIVVEILKVYAQMLNNIADLEEATGKRFDEYLKELLTPARFVELYEKMPPDIYGELMALLFRLATLSSIVQNPIILPTGEKRRIASEILKISESLEKIILKLGAR